MNRRLLFILVALLLLAAAAGGVGLELLTTSHPSSTGKVTVTTTPTTPPLTMKDVTRLETALNSPAMASQATAFLPDLAKAYLAQSKSILPPGATVRVLPATKVCKNLSCEVDALVTDTSGKQTTFTLYLDHSTGQWLIAGTNQKK